MKFSYTVNQVDSEDSDQFAASREPNVQEIVRVVFDNKSVSILANQEGWAYLAKICAEMAYSYSNIEGFHIHRTAKFEIADQGNEKISFHQISPDADII